VTVWAREICRRYYEEFADEDERYGPAGRAWCVHDNQHILQWGILDATGEVDLHGQVAWLASVLGARGFPLDRLARDLELAADVVEEEDGLAWSAVGARLRDAAGRVRPGEASG
jgi:hypothetical protein